MSMTTNKQAPVQRYANYGVDMMEWAEGGYVKYDAYQALLDELEAAERGVAELNDALCKLLPGCQYMDPPDGGSVSPLEQVSRIVADYRERMEAAERRIAELEARSVIVPSVSDDAFWLNFNGRFVFREETYRSAVFKALDSVGIKNAAGITTKGE